MIVYHGGCEKIKKIDLTKAVNAKDFGRGFYVTSVRQQAEKWAIRQGKNNNINGVVSDFEFNYSRAFSSREFKTKKFDGYTEEWLEFIKTNRMNFEDINVYDFDIVEGPIADDWVNATLHKYIKNEMSSDTFLKKLKYDGSHQICLRTTLSLDLIEPISLSASFKISDIGISLVNYLEKNDNFLDKKAQDLYYESETYKKLTDEDTMLYTKSWQEIYDMLKRKIEK